LKVLWLVWGRRLACRGSLGRTNLRPGAAYAGLVTRSVMATLPLDWVPRS